FHSAEAVGVDVVRPSPALVAASCTDPPFLALCQGLAVHDRTRARGWAVIFSVASTRFMSVAKALAATERPPVWDELVSSVRRHNRWDPVPGKRAKRRSMLGAALSVALDESSSEMRSAAGGK